MPRKKKPPVEQGWDTAVAQGRKAFADGKTDHDCPYPRGRMAAGWLTGRMEAFAETDEAKANEAKSLAAAHGRMAK